MISTASCPKFIFGAYYNILVAGNDIGALNLMWMGSGFVLLVISFFGLWSVLKESFFLMNLYTINLSLTLILQILTATTSNTLSGKLSQIVAHSIDDLMVHYGKSNELSSVMDSIQIEYKCCGNSRPSDWYLMHDFTMKEPLPPPTTQSPTSLPISCCKDDKCRSYYNVGCLRFIYKDIARVVLVIKLVAMIASVLQIFGVLAAYIFGKTLRDQTFRRESFGADRMS
ncbi:CD63 antigen [Pseudolycoriella hygida]|uniref:Tetraspanin n=1 Tax=Pseudolycoriella hygida TaxID=35572 RepID=A0A9Q0N7X0_9DIPT|nr:CD63 antigen [Pseudolycoriella hygida]